jgi:mRNA interferase MazF
MINLDPTRGHEQAGTRPCLIVSADPFNRGPARLVVIVPITSRARNIPSHVELNPPEGGLTRRSFIKCEDVRSASTERLLQRMGAVSSATLTQVEDRLRLLLDL